MWAFNKSKGIDYSKFIDGKWIIAQSEFNNKPLFIRLNQSLKEIVGDKNYFYRIGIAVPLAKPNEHGLSSEEEQKVLELIEDRIIQTLSKDLRGFLSIVLSTCGMREFIIYSKENKIIDIIDNLKQTFPNYDFQNYVVEDKDWEEYNNWYR